MRYLAMMILVFFRDFNHGFWTSGQPSDSCNTRTSRPSQLVDRHERELVLLRIQKNNGKTVSVDRIYRDQYVLGHSTSMSFCNRHSIVAVPDHGTSFQCLPLQ
ncbi:hypothetical protein EV361DRAFT_923821 [Lentinula raphanica]|nr:hypothetical protein EV361DRAFT_923821 [Lentinula raphanica]